MREITSFTHYSGSEAAPDETVVISAIRWPGVGRMRIPAILALLAMAALPALAQTEPPPFDLIEVDRIMNDALSAFTRGLSLTVQVDGRRVYRKSFGAFESDRRVPVASATKWYSAAVVLGVVDRGALRLNDSAARYLPSFQGNKAGITLRQLLSHTSGLVGDVPCLYDGSSTMAGCVDEIAAEPVLFPPGTRFSYGNAAMQVAGRMAEVATGKSWQTLFQENLATPLGMTCTTLDAFGSANHPVVANGARSCESDYLKFLEMVLADGSYGSRQVLSATSVSDMMRDQTGGVPIAESIYSDYGDLDPGLPRLRYGLGAWRERVNVSSGEALELGSQGATGFSPWLDRERNLAAVLSTESSQNAIMATYVALKAALRKAIAPWAQRSLRVVDAASLRTGAVAPGELITVFGSGIGPVKEAAAQVNGSLFSNSLGDTRVLFDGVPAPLLYAGWNQINTVAPFAIQGKDRTQLWIERNGERGPAVTIAVAAAAPAIFRINETRGVVLNEDGTLNSSQNPARRGSIIVIYATGGGQTDPPTFDGQLQPGLSSVRGPAQIKVGGVPAEILYCGGAPGLIAGALQVNARLSTGSPAGDSVPIVLAIAGAESFPVTLSIR